MIELRREQDERGRTWYTCHCLLCGMGSSGRLKSPNPCDRTFHECKNQKIPCIHLGDVTDETVVCESCSGRVRLKLHECAELHRCLPTKKLPDVPYCQDCELYRPSAT